MFVDSRTLEQESTITSDICIIGAGAAGITIAREFLGGTATVSVIAGGGMTPDGATQALSDGESVDGRYFPPIAAAVRSVGGNTTHWGSWSRRFEPIDFRQRDWVPLSGWPIDLETLEPFYKRAHAVLKLGSETFDPRAAANEAGDPSFSVITTPISEVETKIWRFHKPPVCFGRDHQEELAPSSNIKIYLDSHAVDIALNEDGTAVREIAASTLEGLRFTFKAKTFILAAGGLQNPRLLLASNGVQKAGAGNQNDSVGRYFMDHPHLHHNGLIVLSDIKKYPYLYDTNSQYDKFIVGGLCPSEEYQTSAKILNCAVNFKPSHRSASAAGVGEGWSDSIAAMWDDVLSFPGKAYRRARKTFGLKNTSVPERQFLDVITRCEQTPNPLSRVLLHTDKDPLGMPKIKIDWRVTGLERRTMLEMHKKLAAAFGSISLGRFKVELLERELKDNEPWNTAGEEGRFEGGWHHMGTTRMSDDPKLGVVDRDCKVHGIHNLYVAGSSVFPTSSAFNPTMTLVALAYRLADHLKEKVLVEAA